MSAGRPLTASNVTLCPVDSNVKLIVVPTATVSDAGSNLLPARAITVFAGTCDVPVPFPVPVPVFVAGAVLPPPLQADATSSNVAQPANTSRFIHQSLIRDGNTLSKCFTCSQSVVLRT